ncbi:hypothetical protein Tco_1206991, partial [Tanacetum coccineum]
MEYRQSYYWDMYQGVFEHMAGFIVFYCREPTTHLVMLSRSMTSIISSTYLRHHSIHRSISSSRMMMSSVETAREEKKKRKEGAKRKWSEQNIHVILHEDRGIDARVVVEAVDQDETETGVKGLVKVRDERVTHPVMPEDILEPAQEGVVEVTYETLRYLVQRFHDHTQAILVHRIQ